MSTGHLADVGTQETDRLISFINTEQFDKLDEAWLEFVESDNKNLQAIFEVIELLAKRDEKKRVNDFLSMLMAYYKQRGIYSDALAVLKMMLKYNPKGKGLAKEIAECYSNIYKDKPEATVLIEKAGIETAIDVSAAIKKLEKYFYFDCGDYVNHKSWGVGQVASVDIEGERINISFEKRNNHNIAMDIAPDILQKLDKDDLLVMIYARKDELDKLVETDPVGLIKLTLKYFKGKASVANVKKRLISGVMPPDSWSKWWTNTKKQLKKDMHIKLTEGTPTTSFLELRASPMTHHQEILERLGHTKDIAQKIEIAKKYISEMKQDASCKETLSEITGHFIHEIDKQKNTNHSLAAECFLLLEEMQNLLGDTSEKYRKDFEAVVLESNNLPELVNNMNILEYKKRSLSITKKIQPEKWQMEFVSLFFVNDGNLWEFIIKELISGNKQESLEGVAHKVFNQFNAYPEHYLWFCKNCMYGRFPELYQNADPATMFSRLIELLDNIYFKIQKGRDGNFKTIINKIKNLLEDKGAEYAISILDDANAENIFNIVSGSKGLEDWCKVMIEGAIKDRFPDKFEETAVNSFDESKIYVTAAGYEKKKNEFNYLMNVEFAENARDLGEAISKGDLRENAEYKAAREKQALLVEKAERTKAELQKAVMIDPRTVQSDKICPGTKVTLKNGEKPELEIYTILGPWDVDIERGIISYLSPIGKGLLDKVVGDIVTIKLPEGTSTYEIIKIEKAL